MFISQLFTKHNLLKYSSSEFELPNSYIFVTCPTWNRHMVQYSYFKIDMSYFRRFDFDFRSFLWHVKGFT